MNASDNFRFLKKTGKITSQEDSSETTCVVLRFLEESTRELSQIVFVANLAKIEPKENMVFREVPQPMIDQSD